MQTREPKKYVSKVATSSGIVMSSEILADCFSNMGRNIRTVSKFRRGCSSATEHPVYLNV